ncbi:YvcK family protein [Dehalococcoidia bacterium]|nr:YvcK family protein [Dehalococcoidia bacterium]
MSKKIKKIYPERSRRVVCLGGGNAMPKAVLQGLKKYPVEISVICAMLDSGGSAGRLRKDYNIISPGDIRRAFIALANTSPAIENLFNYRFKVGGLKGHNFANLFITALELSANNGKEDKSSFSRFARARVYEKTLKELNRILNVSHQVLPATIDNSNIYAVLENGKIISGEANIDIPKHDGNLRIKRVFLKPKAKAYPKSLEAINKADLIIIGPGDLYSSLAQILLIQGIPEAIRKSKAQKVYICNLMTKYGETNNFSVLDFTNEIEKYLGGELDYVIYNNFIPGKKIIKKYQKTNPELLNLVKIDKDLLKSKFIGKNLLTKDSGEENKSSPSTLRSAWVIEHDPKKVSQAIIDLL